MTDHYARLLQRVTNAKDDERLPASFDDIVERQLDALLVAAATLGVPASELRTRLNPVQAFRDPTVNAMTVSTDDWQTVTLGLNVGLMTFFHKMIKVFTSRVGAMGQDGPAEGLEIPWERTVSVCYELMKAFWDGTLHTTHGFRLNEFSELQITVGAHLLDAAEMFILGHELGHAAMNCFPGQIDSEAVGRDLAEQIMRRTGVSLSEDIRQHLISTWGEEIGADHFGFAATLATKANDTQRIMAYWAVELAFIQMDMLEQFHVKYRGEQAKLGSHPSSFMRRQAIRAAVDPTNPGNTLGIGQGLAELGQKILDAI